MINSRSLWKVGINLLMLLFPPPYRCCKRKNTISKPNPAAGVSNLQNTTSLCNTDDFFYSWEKGTLYKEVQAFGVVAHSGFLSLSLPCLLWILPGARLTPYWMKPLETNNESFYNRPSLNCGSFLFYSSPGTSYVLLRVSDHLTMSCGLSSQWYHRLWRAITLLSLLSSLVPRRYF